MGGGEKAFLKLGGVSLIERILSRLRPQVEQVIINANGDPQRFHGLDCTVVPDKLAVETPLAGWQAVVDYGWRNGFDAVLTVPSDAPLIPLNLVSRLEESGRETGAAIASSAGQLHHLTGLWSTAMAEVVTEKISAKGLRRVQDLGEILEISQAAWPTEPHDPFLNINTPEDLAMAEAMIHE
jgi:molybdopterin-guanine dinucleotide biosynthesis protein A